MIRGLEKNNEGEKLTKQETKNSGDQRYTMQSVAPKIWQRGGGGGGTAGDLRSFPQPPEAKRLSPQRMFAVFT